jgi:hypothetical protein
MLCRKRQYKKMTMLRTIFRNRDTKQEVLVCDVIHFLLRPWIMSQFIMYEYKFMQNLYSTYNAIFSNAVIPQAGDSL